MRKIFISTFYVLFNCLYVYSQTTYFGDEPVKWLSSKAPVIPQFSKVYENTDVIIVKDQTQFYFYANDDEKIVRRVLIKLNTALGVEQFKTCKLPESFDMAYDAYMYKQGRKAKIKIPFISEYKVTSFAARKYSDKTWKPITFNLNYEKLRWVKYTGEFMNDELTIFQLKDLAPGDVIEVYYEINFNSLYGSNLFYFHSNYPKLSTEYEFIYKVSKNFSSYSFIFPLNIPDSLISKSVTEYKDYNIFNHKIVVNNTPVINYPSNSYESKSLPHVFADFKFYRVVSGSYPTANGRLYEYDLYRPKNFEWFIFSDTANNYTKIYDKQFTSLRKFISTIPTEATDSSKIGFFKALCDTFNNFRYISSNHLFYNESALYDLYSANHLLKRRLVEHSMWKLYIDILNDKKIFYYQANVIDKRYGEHNTSYRAHYAYENELVAVPFKNSYFYFMPRYNGIKYHLNELPFYYEGSLVALTARNFQDNIKNKEAKTFKLLKTHKGTYNENTRTESATVKIHVDSLTAHLTIKESLSGQFSTLLRHLYLNEYIDSTVSPHYFKKCTDKPQSFEQKVKLSSNITEFPFRYTFNCTEKIKMVDNKSLSLKNWFSFTLSKAVFSNSPSHDYYFDYDYSDSYNFLLNFSNNVQLTNSSDFTKKINNDFFELDSQIVKNTDSLYLMKVKLIVKQQKIPLEHMKLLMDLVNELETLNNFTLSLN